MTLFVRPSAAADIEEAHAWFYRVVEVDVVVTACFHASRDPHRWHTRE